MNMRETKKRLRSLGRSLRPLEQEAERLNKELEGELIRIDDGIGGFTSTKPTPAQLERYHEMDELQGIADMAQEDIKQIREAIARLLRPKPKAKKKPVYGVGIGGGRQIKRAS